MPGLDNINIYCYLTEKVRYFQDSKCDALFDRNEHKIEIKILFAPKYCFHLTYFAQSNESKGRMCSDIKQLKVMKGKGECVQI